MLPDAVLGLPYQGHLVTSHKAGGTLSIVAGALPPGLTLPATFGGVRRHRWRYCHPAGHRTHLRLHRSRHWRPGPAVVSGLPDHRGPEPAANHRPARQRVNPGGGRRRPGLRAELLPQRRGRTLHLGRCRRATPARPDPADVRRGLPTPATSSPGHRPRPAPSPSLCGSPTTPVSKQPSISPSPSNPERHTWPGGPAPRHTRHRAAPPAVTWRAPGHGLGPAVHRYHGARITDCRGAVGP